MLRVNEIKAELKRTTGELERTKSERDTLKNTVKKNLDELKRISEENDQLKNLLTDVNTMEYLELKKAVTDLNVQKEKAKDDLQQFDEWFAKRKDAANQQLTDVSHQVELLQKQVVILNDEILFQSFGLYEPHYNLQNSEQYRLRLEDVRAKQKWLVKTEKAVVFHGNVSSMGSFNDGEKLTKDFVKLIFRSFNNECDTNIASVKFNNAKSIEKKIFNDYDALNKLGKRMNISIAREYLNLKLDELYLCYEYQAKKQDEKEDERRIREQMREEAKLLKEIEEVKAKVEKEQTHFNKALEKINSQLSQVQTEQERALLEKEKQGIEQKVLELEKDLQDVLNREQNTRADYVYIISNIGSFGEKIYKIGVTRRLDPTERVDELGDASVPFTFDIHAMIFSEDAPALENALHKAFEHGRLNLINRRREFFNVGLDEIEKVVKMNFNKPVDFIKTPEAAQYRESLMRKKQQYDNKNLRD